MRILQGPFGAIIFQNEPGKGPLRQIVFESHEDGITIYTDKGFITLDCEAGMALVEWMEAAQYEWPEKEK